MAIDIIVDWISVTIKDGKICPSDWSNKYEVREKGLLGYTVQVEYDDGRIELSNPDRADMGHHVIYSGSTLREMEDRYGQSAFNIVKFHAKQGHRFTRLDVAIDVLDEFTARECIKQYEAGKCVSPLRRADAVLSLNDEGSTLYVGRRGGDRMVRIYDKAAQTGTEGVWTRIECELRGRGAYAMVNAISESADIQKTCISSIKSICDFPTWQQWSETLVQSPIPLDMERKLTSATEHWLMTKVAPSLAKFAYNHDGFLEKFAEHVNMLIIEMGANGKS